MPRKLTLIFCIIIVGTTCCFEGISQPFQDPGIQTSLHKLDSVLKPLVMRHAGSLQKGYASPFIQYSEQYGTDVIKAMLLMSDSPHALRTLGVELQSVIRLNDHRHGFLVTTELPIDLLPEVAMMRNVTYIHAARRARLAAPALDRSAIATGASQVWESNPTYTGRMSLSA